MNDQAAEIAVVEAIKSKGIAASYEYPGFVFVPLPNDRCGAFGIQTVHPKDATPYESWTGDYQTDSGDRLGYFELGTLPPDTDPQTVADTIVRSLQTPVLN